MPSLFQPLKQGSVKTRVADAIRVAIYSGHLRPGDPLLEMQLAKDFRVSQTSVREALLQLERLGLVRRFPNKGTQVTELSEKEFRERLELRMQLECTAAVQAGARLQDRDAQALTELADRIASRARESDFATAAMVDLEFHRRMWAISGNEILAQVLHQISAPLFAFVSIVRTRRRSQIPIVLHSHHEIVDALASRDAALIHKTMQNHFAGSYEQFVPHLSSVPDIATRHSDEAGQRSKQGDDR